MDPHFPTRPGWFCLSSPHTLGSSSLLGEGGAESKVVGVGVQGPEHPRKTGSPSSF